MPTLNVTKPIARVTRHGFVKNTAIPVLANLPPAVYPIVTDHLKSLPLIPFQFNKGN